MIPRILLLITFTSAGTAIAYEDDLLLDVSPAAVFQTGTDVKNPDLGGTVGLTWGFSDRTDMGGYVHFEDIERKGNNTGTGNSYVLARGPETARLRVILEAAKGV